MNTESRLARVGLKKEQKIAPILEKYNWLYDLPTINFVKKRYQEETNPNKKEQLKLLFYDLSDFFLYRKVIAIDDQLATFFNKTKVKVDGEKITFHNLGPLIGKSADFGKREKFHKAYLGVIKEVNQDFLLTFKSVLKSIKSDLGFEGYIDFYQKKKTIDYSQFQKTIFEINSQLQSLYHRKMRKFVEENLHHPWQNLKSCHLNYLRSLNRFDQYFPKEKLMPVFTASMKGLGIDIKKQKNIKIDTAKRPGKNPRAVCYNAKVPQEVHLIIKSVGGFYDFEAFFHEGGHAEHFAHVKTSLPFAFRHLESSAALPELFSFLFESLARNPLWLEKYLNLSQEIAQQVAYESEMVNLFMLIRYLAKFSYEYQLFSSGDLSLGPQLYAETLTKFTNFVYNPVDYLNDMDGTFYSADYLRAWIGEAQLTGFFKKKYGPYWFEKREVGDWLKKIWAKGSQFDLEEILEKNKIGKPFDINSLVSRFKKSLAEK
jgi:oligoendopeptidase F